jgi:hypothetical protein
MSLSIRQNFSKILPKQNGKKDLSRQKKKIRQDSQTK